MSRKVVEPMPRVEAPARSDVAAAEAEGDNEKKPVGKIRTKQKSEATPVQRNTLGAADDGGAALGAAHRERRRKAPSPGNAASRAAIASWRDLVVARLQQHKRYPAAALAGREQGVVMLSFSVDHNGRVLARSISKSSRVGRPSTRRYWRWSNVPSRYRRFRRR